MTLYKVKVETENMDSKLKKSVPHHSGKTNTFKYKYRHICNKEINRINTLQFYFRYSMPIFLT